MFAVEKFDYDGLVARMAEAGMSNMGQVLNEALGELPKPRLQAEREYFWKALHNASRKNTIVWLWLVRQMPELDLDTERGLHTDPQFTSDWDLPEIHPDSEEIDYEKEERERPPQYPAKPTEENFRGQAYVLEQWFRDNAKPEDNCRNVKEYVDSFRHSGTGMMMAQLQLSRHGLNALATRQGIEWLMSNYPEE